MWYFLAIWRAAGSLAPLTRSLFVTQRIKYQLETVPFTKVTVADSFSGPRIETSHPQVVDNQGLTFIPYYTWAHRGVGEMAVWVKRT
jgi:hypothetical protein